MSPPKNAKQFTKLLNGGPLPSTEIDTSISPEQRRDGVRKFHPQGASLGSSLSGGPMTKTPVYYIEGKHSHGSVIQTWLEANEKTVEGVGIISIHQRISGYGQAWKEASRRILGPFEEKAHGHGDGTPDIDQCPLCGSDDFVDSLSTHLPECPEA